jgi:glycosyltransferase involved in cell wall biosynthesis
MKNIDDLEVESFATHPESLRIAIVTETFPPEVNGVAMTLGRIVEGILARGHALQVVRPRQTLDTQRGPRPGMDEVLSRGIALPAYGELQFGLPARGRLVKLWSEKRPDIVHVVTEGPLGWSAVAAARKLHLPITSSFHTNFQSYSTHYGIALLKSPIDSYLRKLHNKTRATLVPTKALIQELERRGYENLTLLSRGVATELFSPTKRSISLRQSWSAGPDDLVVLLVGRLAREKNVGLVVSAFRSIQSRVANAKLVFVGDGPMKQNLKEACPEAHFAGTRRGEDLAAHYASGDLFLFPSVTETFGNVVPEALASGLAVVSYDIAAAKELIESGRNGVLVPVGDELAFINASAELATQVHLRTEIRNAAAKSVSHLGWDAVYDSFLRILKGVLQNHGREFGSLNQLTVQSSARQHTQQRLSHSNMRTLL